MKTSTNTLRLTTLFSLCIAGAACSRPQAQTPADPTATQASAVQAPAPQASTPPMTPSDQAKTQTASSLDALPPPSDDTSAQSRHGLTMNESPNKIEPTIGAIPLPTKIEVPSQAGVDTAIKAVPKNVPLGQVNKTTLEAPLRDPKRFEQCRIPYGTHIDISAVVYNGSTLGVDVTTKPVDKALAFCIERTVRQTTFVKELAVNRVKVSF